VAERVPWTATLAATLATDGRALLRMGQNQQARIQLLRAEGLALKHGLPHVLQEARSSRETLVRRELCGPARVNMDST